MKESDYREYIFNFEKQIEINNEKIQTFTVEKLCEHRLATIEHNLEDILESNSRALERISSNFTKSSMKQTTAIGN